MSNIDKVAARMTARLERRVLRALLSFIVLVSLAGMLLVASGPLANTEGTLVLPVSLAVGMLGLWRIRPATAKAPRN